MNEEEIQAILLKWTTAGKLSQATLSAEGLALDGVSLPRDARLQAGSNAYSVASIYLQILNPSQKLMEYRNACKTHQVNDPVRPTDKAKLLELFALDDKKDTEGNAADKDKRGSSKRKKDKRAEQPATKPKKKAKAVSNEELFSNLTQVVDRRQEGTEENQQQELAIALSTDGFDPQLTPALRDEYRRQLVREIPVGNSASILRAANPRKDLSRVLEILNDGADKNKRKSNSSNKPKKQEKTYLRGKNPVIIVPKGMTTPITLNNAHAFLAHAKFVPNQRSAQQPPTTFTRTPRVARNKAVEYEIVDNPRKKLGSDPREWERVVAVLCLGQSWQFKGWLPGYEHPVNLFERVFGFYIGIEGDKVPSEIPGWKVGRAQLNRDKRGLDSVTYASFWNALDEWMAIKKPELLPQQD